MYRNLVENDITADGISHLNEISSSNLHKILISTQRMFLDFNKIGTAGLLKLMKFNDGREAYIEHR